MLHCPYRTQRHACMMVLQPQPQQHHKLADAFDAYLLFLLVCDFSGLSFWPIFSQLGCAIQRCAPMEKHTLPMQPIHNAPPTSVLSLNVALWLRDATRSQRARRLEKEKLSSPKRRAKCVRSTNARKGNAAPLVNVCVSVTGSVFLVLTGVPGGA